MANPPLISPLPPAPTTMDRPEDFNRKAFPFVAALESLGAQINSVTDWINATAVGIPIMSIDDTEIVANADNAGSYLRMRANTTKTITAPATGNIPNGSRWLITNLGDGDIEFYTPLATLNNEAPIPKNSSAFLIKVANTVYDLVMLSGSGGGGGMENPMTDEGDLIVGEAGGEPARLAKGSEGQWLTIGGGAVVWGDLPVPTPITLNSDNVSGSMTFCGGTYFVQNGYCYFDLFTKGGDEYGLSGRICMLPVPETYGVTETSNDQLYFFGGKSSTGEIIAAYLGGSNYLPGQFNISSTAMTEHNGEPIHFSGFYKVKVGGIS